MPILESLDEDPEMEPGRADKTPGNADSDKDDENKPASPLGDVRPQSQGANQSSGRMICWTDIDSKSRPAN